MKMRMVGTYVNIYIRQFLQPISTFNYLMELIVLVEVLVGAAAQLATIRSSTVFRRIFMPWLVLTLLAAALTLWNGLAPTHLPRVALAATAHTLLGIALRSRPRLPLPGPSLHPLPAFRPSPAAPRTHLWACFHSGTTSH